MQVEIDCTYTICLKFSEFFYFNLKFGIKQSKIGWKFAVEWLPKAKILGTAKGRWLGFFPKMY